MQVIVVPVNGASRVHLEQVERQAGKFHPQHLTVSSWIDV